MIKAVVFDLDDTLYPEMDYVKSGFAAVAQFAKSEFGLENAERRLIDLFAESSNKVIDRFASECGLNGNDAAQMVEAYRNHKPNIVLLKETKETLLRLRENGYKLGIITDGRPMGQRNKIRALGLESMVDKIIITDELGGVEFRKPNPKAFELMCAEFGTKPEEMLYVGDNPQKDFAIGKSGVKTIKLLNGGLYEGNYYLHEIEPNYIISDLSEIWKCLND